MQNRKDILISRIEKIKSDKDKQGKFNEEDLNTTINEIEALEMAIT